MPARLIILVALLAGAYLAIRWFLRTPPRRLARALKKAALWGGIGLLLLLVASGRLPWVFALVGAAIPFLQRLFTLVRLLPMVRQLLAALGVVQATPAGAQGGASGQQSTIATRYLRMTLDHDSGQMEGTIIEGPHSGRRLGELTLVQLMELLTEYRAGDAQSATVLEAYLDRTHGDAWRATAGDGGQADEPPPGRPGTATMTRQEALRILGLEPSAGDEEIREAHRRLIQRLHPDRGGSTHLAGLINKAKDVLLG